MALSPAVALSRSLRLEPEELNRVAALTLHSFCAVGATMIGRSARDALFLERAPPTWLPWMYFFSALAVALVGLAYGRIAEKLRRVFLTSLAALLFGIITLALWGMFMLNVARIPMALAFYVAVEVMAAMIILQLWTLATDTFDSRQARRIFPIIGLGGSIANIVCGVAGTALAAGLGTGSLILFCAFLLFGVSWLALIEGRLLPGAGQQLPPPRRRAKRVLGPLVSHPHPHLVSIALLVGATFLVTTVIDYQFKLAARSAFSGARLTAFFSAFYAVTGVLALATQTLATRRMLRRIGLVGALGVLPLGLAFGSAAFLVVGRWWAAAISQGCNLTFRYTINDASMQMLYLPLSPGLRARAKSLIEGVEKPVAIGMAALLLVVYQRSGGDPRHLALLVLGLLGGWAWLLLRTRRSYLGALEEKLRLRRLDLEEVQLAGGDAAAVLSHALGSADPAEVAHALELLPHVDPSALEEPLLALLRHPSPPIRALAVGQTSRLKGGQRVEAAVQELLGDPEPSVRAAALRCFCQLRPDRVVSSVSRLIEEESLLVRSAAIAALFLHGGLDGTLVAAPKLRAMLESPAAPERSWAARILGEIGLPTFAESLTALLADPDLDVRRAAAQAAGKVGGPALLAGLISLLGEPATSAEAVEAIVSLGSGVEAGLAAVLRDPLADRNRRLSVPRVLARLGSAPAARVLSEALEIQDEALRTQILIALSRLPRMSPAPDGPLLQRALELELAEAHRLLSYAEDLGLPEQPAVHAVSPSSAEGAAALLALALDEQRFRSLERVLLLLGLLLTRLRAANLRPELFRMQPGSDGTVSGHRGFALELLDNLLPRDLGQRLLPLWDSGPRERRLADLVAYYPDAARTPGGWLEWTRLGSMPWVHACAVHHAAHSSGTVGTAATALGSDDPRVREAGLTSLARLQVTIDAPVLERLSMDPDPGVRREAIRFSSRAARDTLGPVASPMIPTLERVLFLKAAELFSQLPGEELAPMAVLATEEQYAAGTDVLRQGEIGDALYLIVEGRVRMHRRGRVLATLGPHDSFGEMEVLDPAPRFATVTAETDVTLLKLAEADVRDLLQEKHELALGIIQVLTRRLRTANRTKA